MTTSFKLSDFIPTDIHFICLGNYYQRSTIIIIFITDISTDEPSLHERKDLLNMPHILFTYSKFIQLK